MTQRKVYEVVEIMPKFENGEVMIQYLAKNSELFTLQECIANRVFISFVVEADSSITNRKVYVESVFSREKGLLKEGLELKEIQSKIEKGLENLNLMIPGKLNNKAVATRLFFPIHFDIND